jgi:hypothetical protein
MVTPCLSRCSFGLSHFGSFEGSSPLPLPITSSSYPIYIVCPYGIIIQDSVNNYNLSPCRVFHATHIVTVCCRSHTGREDMANWLGLANPFWLLNPPCLSSELEEVCCPLVIYSCSQDGESLRALKELSLLVLRAVSIATEFGAPRYCWNC